MSRKKKALSVIAVCIVMAIIVFIIILNNMPLRCLEIKPDNIPIKISVYSKEKSVLGSLFFSPGYMGQSFDYEIVVEENKLFGKQLLKQSFTYRNDGAPIHESSISVESENTNVIIRIRGSEMNDTKFFIPLE